jgi:Mannosylglycerate hydrolase MGH1-like glycoside hydrolase domain
VIGAGLEPAELGAVRSLCEQTLSQNWFEGVRPSDGVRFAYTRPSPGHYPWQWYWDSCFSAIAWRRFDPGRAERELRSLLAAQQPDGFVGHTIFWTSRPRDIRRFTYNVVSRSAPMTASIQPPLLAWAWRIAVGDPAAEPGIVAHHRWLAEHRDLDGDGLLWIVQPDESGLDASPQFDPIWRHRCHSLPGFVSLVRRNRRLGYDLRRVMQAGGPACCEVMTNVLWGLSRLAMGEPSVTPTMIERMYDERAGVFWPLTRPALAKDVPLTWAALSPLALPDLPEEIGRRLVEEHLLDGDQFWLPVSPPSVSVADPTFSLKDRMFLGFRRYWRGPTWVNSAWLLWLGLLRLGYEEQAEELSRQIASVLIKSGLREYYDPYSGRGMGAPSFAWSSLGIELTEPDPGARMSYLGG